MRKSALFLGLVALVAAACGCSEDKEAPLMDCVHGNAVRDRVNGDYCVCDAHYTKDAKGLCTACAKNYEPKDGKCVRKSDTSQEQCLTTIVYKKEAFRGKAVYLIGDFNKWAKADAKYRFTETGNGVFTLVIDGNKDELFAKDASVQYKVYVDGLLENQSYRTIASKCLAGIDHNCKLDVQCGDRVELDEDDKTDICNPREKPYVCDVTFKYYNAYTDVASGGSQAFSVNVVGDFNEWDPADSRLTMQSDGKGCHSITLAFGKCSTSVYKFHVNGWVSADGTDNGWQSDPYNTNYDNGGNSTAYVAKCGLTFGGCPASGGGGDPIQTTTPTSSNSKLVKVTVGTEMTQSGIPVEIEFKEAPTQVEGGHIPSIEGKKVLDFVPEYGKYTYLVKVGDSEAYVPVWVENEQWDWHNAVLYFAFTDRFKDGDPTNNAPATEASWDNNSNARWLGGDFKGLQQKVEEGYFDKLGVNTLWISSVSMNTQGVSWGTGSDSNHSYSAYHSYWPISAFMTDENRSEFGSNIQPIEPHFGNEASLKALVDACHRRGIRVLVDFAANHVHRDSPFFAKHEDWFNDSRNPQLCDTNDNWNNYPEKCWFSGDLPDVNYENAQARQAMVDHAVWLIKKTNIDGFRVDAVKHMNIQFIKDLRAAVDSLYANTGQMFYMVGETFTGEVDVLNRYIGNDLLHAQFDFPLYYKIGNVLKGKGLHDIAQNYNVSFKSDLMGTFMGNHDVARALSVAAGQNENKWGNNDTPTDWVPYFRVKLAWTILLTRPGVPLIYYGDEAGMPGSNDPDNRRMMIFDDSLNSEQKNMLEYVQKLGQIRKAHPATRFGKRRDLQSDNSNWCYLMEKDDDRILVAIATDNGGSGCDLGGKYTLQNLLDPTVAPFETNYIDMSSDKLNVFQVK